MILTATSHAKLATSLEALCGNTLAYAQGTYGKETAQDTTAYCKSKGKPGPVVKVYSDEPSTPARAALGAASTTNSRTPRPAAMT